MTDRDRFERNRAQRREEHDWNSDYYNDDRSFGSSGPSSRGRYGYGYHNEDSNSSRYDRGYSRLGGAGEEDFERSYIRGEQYGQQYGQRDWGEPRSEYGQRGYGGRNQFPYMGSAYSSQRSFDEGWPGGRYGYGQPSQSSSYGQRTEHAQRTQQRGRFAGRGPKGYKRSDERIREDVSDALMMHPDIDASEIEVKVNDGEVTLTGTVLEREDKYLAEHLCEGVPGVRDVNNSLRVKRASERDESYDPLQRSARSGLQSNVSQGGTSNNSRA